LDEGVGLLELLDLFGFVEVWDFRFFLNQGRLVMATRSIAAAGDSRGVAFLAPGARRGG
jgi:hypothetical protein